MIKIHFRRTVAFAVALAFSISLMEPVSAQFLNLKRGLDKPKTKAGSKYGGAKEPGGPFGRHKFRGPTENPNHAANVLPSRGLLPSPLIIKTYPTDEDIKRALAAEKYQAEIDKLLPERLSQNSLATAEFRAVFQEEFGPVIAEVLKKNPDLFEDIWLKGEKNVAELVTDELSKKQKTSDEPLFTFKPGRYTVTVKLNRSLKTRYAEFEPPEFDIAKFLVIASGVAYCLKETTICKELAAEQFNEVYLALEGKERVPVVTMDVDDKQSGDGSTASADLWSDILENDNEAKVTAD